MTTKTSIWSKDIVQLFSLSLLEAITVSQEAEKFPRCHLNIDTITQEFELFFSSPDPNSTNRTALYECIQLPWEV